MLHIIRKDKNITSIQFLITMGNYTCRTTLYSQNVKRTIFAFNFYTFNKSSFFDIKGFISNIIIMGFYHSLALEYCWEYFSDDYEVRRRHFGLLSL